MICCCIFPRLDLDRVFLKVKIEFLERENTQNSREGKLKQKKQRAETKILGFSVSRLVDLPNTVLSFAIDNVLVSGSADWVKFVDLCPRIVISILTLFFFITF